MDGFIKAKEAAQRLGVHVVTIHNWCQTGSLPYKRVGTRYWIPESAVDELCTAPPVPVAPQSDFLSTGEAARILCLSPDVVRDWCQQGKLPARRPGKTWQIPRQAVVERAQVSGGSPLDADAGYSPLDLRWIQDEFVRDEVASGNIPHPFLMSSDGTEIDWQAWAEERLPLQVAEREWHAKRTAAGEAPGADGAANVVPRARLVDRIMVNARRFMDEAVAQTGTFTNLQILRLVTHDQPQAYVELLASFSDPHPFGAANRQIGTRIRVVAERSGYVRAPDLDLLERDLFGNPIYARFFRPDPKADGKS